MGAVTMSDLHNAIIVSKQIHNNVFTGVLGGKMWSLNLIFFVNFVYCVFYLFL